VVYPSELQRIERNMMRIYTVTLTVIDDDSASDVDTLIVNVQTPEESTQDQIEVSQDVINNNPGTDLEQILMKFKNLYSLSSGSNL